VPSLAAAASTVSKKLGRKERLRAAPAEVKRAPAGESEDSGRPLVGSRTPATGGTAASRGAPGGMAVAAASMVAARKASAAGYRPPSPSGLSGCWLGLTFSTTLLEVIRSSPTVTTAWNPASSTYPT
jgi:hypothetical protein